MMSLKLRIIGSGQYLPKRQCSAAELAERLGVAPSYVLEKVGVANRHFADVSIETQAYMGARAAEQALAAAGLAKEDLGAIIATCGVQQQAIPCTAALIQRELGLGDSGKAAFDTNATCLSFALGFDLAAHLLTSQRYDHILIVAADCASVGLNWQDKESASLFGDGAAAVVVRRSLGSETSQVLGSVLQTLGSAAEVCQIPGGGTRLHPQFHSHQDNIANNLFQMNGPKVFKIAATHLPPLVDDLLQKLKLPLAAIDLVIPHQASLPALELMRRRLKIEPEKFVQIVANTGNCIAASIPMTLHHAIVQGRLQRGHKAMLLGTAAGVSLSALVFEY